jgi:hypothetical protein
MAAVYAKNIAVLPMAHGRWTTASASDTVATGLGQPLKAVFLTPVEAINENNKFFWADLGDQAGSPAAGSFYLKSLKDTDADALPIDATTFTIDVAWLAIGN